jgi:peptidoglycan/xylan/chitin deacetylase (PgdA/CDA1 family)
MSAGPKFSRRRFLRTLVFGGCAWPLARSMARVGEGFGLHPDTPMGRWPDAVAPLAPPRTMGPAFHSAAISSPHLTLTFDDGPHGSLTPRLLDLLARRRVKCTFYVIGRNVEAYPEIARRIVAEGHEIANHTWTHPQLSRLSAERVAEELRRTHETVLEVTGVRMTNLRPPYGAFNDSVRRVAFDRHGYDTIMWSVDPLDWKYRNASRVTRELVKGAAPGAVLLCHDIHPSTVAAMPSTLDQLLGRGFQFVTVAELMAMDESGRQDSNLRPPGPKPGALPS